MGIIIYLILLFIYWLNFNLDLLAKILIIKYYKFKYKKNFINN